MLKTTFLRDKRSWNSPPDYDSAKPLRAAQIAKLGDELDEFENAPHWSIGRGDAEANYMTAVRDRAWFQIKKFEAAKRVPSRRDGQRLRSELIEAQCRLDEATTAREECDALAAVKVASSKFHIAQRKYQQARRQAKADERAGKNVFTLRGMTFRRKPK